MCGNVGDARRVRDDALMVRGFAAVTERHAQLVELFAIDFAHYKLAIARKRDDLAERAVVLVRDENTVDASAALDRFAHRVASDQKVRLLVGLILLRTGRFLRSRLVPARAVERLFAVGTFAVLPVEGLFAVGTLAVLPVEGLFFPYFSLMYCFTVSDSGSSPVLSPCTISPLSL